MSLETELLSFKSAKSFNAFTHLVEGFELADFQAISILLWLKAKKGLALFDPGMGKTITTCAGIKALHNKKHKTKTIFLIKKAQITQTANDVRTYTGLRVVTCTGEHEQIETKMSRDVSSYDVLMLTHEALESDRVGVVLYQIAKEIDILVVDEAHYLTNLEDSDKVYVLAALAARIEYVMFLTATPFITKGSQLASLLNIMDNKTFERRDHIAKQLRDLNRIDTQYPLQIYNYDRKSEGISNTYETYCHWVEPHPHQLRVEKAHYLRHVRGNGAENQATELIRQLKIKKAEGKRGLVYIYYSETLQWVLPFLQETSLKFDCINGDTPQPQRDRIQEEFQQNLLDVVVISVSTSINLDCEYVFMYEYTHEFKQILGRAERGLNPKRIELHFIFTKKTQDAQHFLDTVYKLSGKVRSWIGKEYTEFLGIGEKVMAADTGL